MFAISIVLFLGAVIVVFSVVYLYRLGVKKRNEAPNVILIVADALSAGHMSLYGYDRATTPFMDEFFGKHGLVYINAKSNASWTLPSFASFMRSKLPSHIQVKDLLEDKQTLPAVLRKNQIAIVGILKDFSKPLAILQIIGRMFKKDEYRTVGYHDHETTFREAAKWLNEHDWDNARNKRPFFMLVHDATAHNPYEDAPQKYRMYFGTGDVAGGPTTNKPYLNSLGVERTVTRREKERITLLYDQEVRHLDDLMKNFIQSLPRQVLERSVLIFTADHGDEFGNHNNRFNHGHSLYEELIHVPFMIKVPGAQPKHVSTPISLLDLAPTVLSFFGIKSPASFEGEVIPTGNSRALSERILRSEGNKMSFNVEQHLSDIGDLYLDRKLLNPPDEIACYKRDWKLMRRNNKFELYNLLSDSKESIDVYKQKSNLSELDKHIVDELLSEI